MRMTGSLALAAGLVLLAGCSATYHSNPQMNYYHGQMASEGFIEIVRASPAEITFSVRIEFDVRQMYHLILDGNTPVAQGWYSVIRAGNQPYLVTIKPSKGMSFEPGKTYRLCIGKQSPEEVQMTSSNYECRVEYTFVFQEKA